MCVYICSCTYIFICIYIYIYIYVYLYDMFILFANPSRELQSTNIYHQNRRQPATQPVAAELGGDKSQSENTKEGDMFVPCAC